MTGNGLVSWNPQQNTFGYYSQISSCFSLSKSTFFPIPYKLLSFVYLLIDISHKSIEKTELKESMSIDKTLRNTREYFPRWAKVIVSLYWLCPVFIYPPLYSGSKIQKPMVSIIAFSQILSLKI